ncbi:MAG: hypothetical protein F4Y18_01500, partial [Cenarchaeum sp. SB0663_bin_5]|nr:hypothetical protein [Cenarchaeum sp. SB0663_bin_5]
NVKCSISECSNTAVKTIKVGSKETRNLCKTHLVIYMNRERQHTPIFHKASNIPRDYKQV